ACSTPVVHVEGSAGIAAVGEVGGGARIAVVLGVGDDAGSDGVAFDVAQGDP
ncbi:MAG: hypothetical protein RL328_787, partial [Acidobacteriota bacterium]